MTFTWIEEAGSLQDAEDPRIHWLERRRQDSESAPDERVLPFQVLFQKLDTKTLLDAIRDLEKEEDVKVYISGDSIGKLLTNTITLFARSRSDVDALLAKMKDGIIISSGLSVPLESVRGGDPGAADQGEPATFEPGSVIMGIIDDGIAFANDRFRDAGGSTRFLGMLIQSFRPIDSELLRNIPARTLGLHLPKPAINKLFELNSDGGVLNESELYSWVASVTRTDVDDFENPRMPLVMHHASHGTLTLDLAAGLPSSQVPGQMKDLRPIIGVQLPSDVIARTSGAGLEAYIFDAVEFILNQALLTAEDQNEDPLPVVINLSFGRYGGSHDGRSNFEEQLAEKLAAYPGGAWIVMPSGNHAQNRVHAQLPVARIPDSKNEAADVEMVVQPDNADATLLEVWLAAKKGRFAKVRLEAPDGTSIDVDGGLQEGTFRSAVDNKGQTVAQIYRPKIDNAKHGDRVLITIALAPTTDKRGVSGTISAGIWKLRFSEMPKGVEGNVDLYIERGDSLAGYRFSGRQSYFVDQQYKPYTATGRLSFEDDASSYIKRSGTLSGLAGVSSAPQFGAANRVHDRTVLLVGGHRQSDGKPAYYSSQGPNVAGRSPDVSFPSDVGAAHRGILASGNLSGSSSIMGGTSMAAPVAAKRLADILAENLVATGRDADAVMSISDAAAVREHVLAATDYRHYLLEGAISGNGRLPSEPTTDIERIR